MAAPRSERRLAAILAADVIGYSRLMERDEDRTLARLKAHRREFIEPLVAEHQGRIVKLMGDGALVEFASIVDAVRCAALIQQGVAEREKDVPGDERVRFRIGINLGDVIHEADGDLYGDGVNIAARLEQLAEPGGVLISGTAYDHLQGKLDLPLEFVGEQQVKNLAKPVRAYRVVLDGGRARPPWRARLRRARRPLAAMAAVLALVVAGAVAFIQTAPAFEPASVKAMAFPLPEKPSLAVLPLDNLSGDAAQDVLAAGLTEAIVTTLAKVPDLFVIDRNSTATYRGKPAGIKEVAEALGVRYVLEGSVQRSGDRVRISAHLADALSGRSVWSEDYDSKLADIFDLQDDITRQVMTELQVKLTQGKQAELRRHQTRSADAYMAFLQGVEVHNELTNEAQVKAQELLGKAVELDPGFASAYAFLGFTYVKQARLGWVADPEATRARGVGLIEKALAIDPDNVDAINNMADVLIDRGERDAAIAIQRRGAALAPNHADVLASLGYNPSLNGRPEEGLPLVESAMRLSPRYPTWYLAALGWTCFFLGEYDKAIAASEARRRLAPNSEVPLIYLIAMLPSAGRLEEARAAVADLKRIVPDYSMAKFASFAAPWFSPENLAVVTANLRAAGIPD